MSEPMVREWCFQILRGLAHIHKHGYFHRDLKPGQHRAHHIRPAICFDPAKLPAMIHTLSVLSLGWRGSQKARLISMPDMLGP